jgi:hypothetical protein
MTDNYARLIRANLNKLYSNLPDDLCQSLPASQKTNCFIFKAFGEQCQIQPQGIFLGHVEETGVLGILISLYALNAHPDPQIVEPLKSFKDFPNSMPYVGAFATHTERILIPHVAEIEKARLTIMEIFQGRDASRLVGGDFSFLICPLPKISLCYIFYHEDDEFPASVTCLFSSNARTFLPLDALADIGEYTSRKIMNLLA